MKILIFMAQYKYQYQGKQYETILEQKHQYKQLRDIASALQLLYDRNLQNFAERRNWSEFRDLYVHHPRVADILVDNMNYLRRIYISNGHLANGRAIFSAEDSLRICRQIMDQQAKKRKKRTLHIEDKIATTCYGLSKMTVKNISKDFSRTRHMVFVEFLEFICRIAYASPVEVNYNYDSNQSDEGGRKPGK